MCSVKSCSKCSKCCLSAMTQVHYRFHYVFIAPRWYVVLVKWSFVKHCVCRMQLSSSVVTVNLTSVVSRLRQFSSSLPVCHTAHFLYAFWWHFEAVGLYDVYSMIAVITTPEFVQTSNSSGSLLRYLSISPSSACSSSDWLSWQSAVVTVLYTSNACDTFTGFNFVWQRRWCCRYIYLVHYTSVMSGVVEYSCSFYSLSWHLTLGTVFPTVIYYLKLLTLLNHDLINFGNIKIWFMISK